MPIRDRSLEHRLNEIERRLDDMRTSQLALSRIGSGGLEVADGGKLTFLDTSGNPLFTIDENGLVTFEADGSQLSVLDGSKLRFNRADGTRILEITPAGGLKVYATNGSTVRSVLDGDGLDIGSGLTVIDSTGVQVGSDVVIDSTGLHVDGGDVVAVEHDHARDGVVNASVTTTETTFVTVTMTPPSWAQRMICWATIRNQFSESSTQRNVTTGFRIGAGATFDNRQQTLPVGTTQSFTATTSFDESSVSLPSSFDLHARSLVSSGTNATNIISLSAQAIYLR